MINGTNHSLLFHMRRGRRRDLNQSSKMSQCSVCCENYFSYKALFHKKTKCPKFHNYRVIPLSLNLTYNPKNAFTTSEFRLIKSVWVKPIHDFASQFTFDYMDLWRNHLHQASLALSCLVMSSRVSSQKGMDPVSSSQNMPPVVWTSWKWNF